MTIGIRSLPMLPRSPLLVCECSIATSERFLPQRVSEAAAPQNLGMSVGFQVEGKLFLRWLANESSVNQSIVTTLFERYRWKRTTVDGK